MRRCTQDTGVVVELLVVSVTVTVLAGAVTVVVLVLAGTVLVVVTVVPGAVTVTAFPVTVTVLGGMVTFFVTVGSWTCLSGWMTLPPPTLIPRAIPTSTQVTAASTAASFQAMRVERGTVRVYRVGGPCKPMVGSRLLRGCGYEGSWPSTPQG